MKRGDIVTIRDFSYSKIVENGKLSDDFHAYHSDASKQFIIVETGCSFPLINGDRYDSQPDEYRNDTVIQAVDSGKVVFIHERFLKPVEPKHKVMVDMTFFRAGGQIVEISDKLYQEIKRDSQAK